MWEILICVWSKKWLLIDLPVQQTQSFGSLKATQSHFPFSCTLFIFLGFPEQAYEVLPLLKQLVPCLCRGVISFRVNDSVSNKGLCFFFVNFLCHTIFRTGDVVELTANSVKITCAAFRIMIWRGKVLHYVIIYLDPRIFCMDLDVPLCAHMLVKLVAVGASLWLES